MSGTQDAAFRFAKGERVGQSPQDENGIGTQSALLTIRPRHSGRDRAFGEGGEVNLCRTPDSPSPGRAGASGFVRLGERACATGRRVRVPAAIRFRARGSPPRSLRCRRRSGRIRRSPRRRKGRSETGFSRRCSCPVGTWPLAAKGRDRDAAAAGRRVDACHTISSCMARPSTQRPGMRYA